MRKSRAAVMRKSRAAVRPVIAPGRVSQPVYQAIKEAAAESGRSLSEELANLAQAALDHRKRFPSSLMAQLLEMGTIAFLLAGETYAQHNKIDGPWQNNPEARREAVLNLCATIITNFISDPHEQA